MPVPEGIHLYSWVDENDDEQHQVTKSGQGFPPDSRIEGQAWSDKYYADGETVDCVKTPERVVVGKWILDVVGGVKNEKGLPVKWVKEIGCEDEAKKLIDSTTKENGK